jgi:two-component system, cell cycle sensor histidine kinase and response regulator CckA
MARIALIVEDDPAIRAYIRLILQRENFETLEADGGNPAFEMVAASGGALDLIVTDIQMPNGDGLTFANAVRKAHPSVPIILTSGHSKPDTAFAFIEKPFSWATLVSVARKLVTSRVRAA